MTDHDPLAPRRWLDDGTLLFVTAVENIADNALADASGLPGWSRKHVIAHVAGNADALTRLAGWARTGIENRMYASPEQRNGDIEAGALLPGEQLRDWLGASSAGLRESLAALSPEQWSHEVLTAQGRTVLASELPWMRAREVLLHAVDLDADVTVEDLPRDFLMALVEDVTAKRSASADLALSVALTDGDGSWQVAGPAAPLDVSGPLTAVAAWLVGRPGPAATTADGNPAPVLSSWL